MENCYLAFEKLKMVLSILILSIVLIMGFLNFDIIWAQDASEDSKFEEVLSGFDDEVSSEKDDFLSPFTDKKDESGSEKDTLSMDNENSWGQALSGFSGNVGLSTSYNYAKDTPKDNKQPNWSGFSKLRSYLSLTWDAKIGEIWKTRISGKAFYDLAYGIKKRETFSEEVLNELEKEVELREVYLEGNPFNSIDIKFGKQVIVWGVADSLRVVDVLNPTDEREFGMTDLEDIRLPINMTKLDYYIGDLKLQAVAVHQIRFNKSAPFGSDFSPSNKKINEVIPKSSIENTEYGLALIVNFSGWDASLNWANYFDDNAHFKIIDSKNIPGVGVITTFEQQHSRLSMAGVTLSASFGNFVWKSEAARLKGLEFALVNDKIFSRTDILIGLEYSGWSDSSFTLESGVQHINDFEKRLEEVPDSVMEDRFATSVIFVQDYFNQTLKLNLVGTMIGKRGEDGGINRASIEYDIFDAFSLKGGLTVYQTGENYYFQSLNTNDRLFFEMRYSY